MQTIAEKILLDVVNKASEQTAGATREASERTVSRTLSQAEECAIMYCGGYVVRRLLKKLEQLEGDKAAYFDEALNSMTTTDVHVDGFVDGNGFEDYVKKWTSDANRGGLKILTDSANDFFKQI